MDRLRETEPPTTAASAHTAKVYLCNASHTAGTERTVPSNIEGFFTRSDSYSPPSKSSITKQHGKDTPKT